MHHHMKTTSTSAAQPEDLRPESGNANLRLALVVVVSLLLGVAISASWFHRSAKRGGPNPAGETDGTGGLSEATRAVLGRLSSPVQLKLYAVLDPGTAPEPLRALADRATGLLNEYQRASAGKITFKKLDARSGGDAQSAMNDGLQPLDASGETFLGIAGVLEGHKDALPRLDPAWESALESDVTRMISRLIDATRPAPVLTGVSQVNTAAVAEVKALIPDVASVSEEDGARMLREAALKEYEQVVKGFSAKVQQLQQQLAEAKSGKSEAEQAAAMKQLQDAQAEQSQKMKEIAIRSHLQVEAFKRMKQSGQ